MSMELFTDIAERVCATFAIGFLTAWLAADAIDLADLGLVRSAGLAGLAAAGSLLKGILASRVGDHDSAAILPADAQPGE